MENGWTERIEELEAERDTWHDRAIAVAAHLDYETTCDNIKIWVYEHKKKVRAIDKRIEELEAENKRLRELVDGATEVVEISNFTFPAQREWKAAWLKKAAKALKEASHEST